MATFFTPATLFGEEARKYKIATIQHQDFHTYTLAYKGFLDGLQSSHLGKDIVVEHFNAKKDLARLNQTILALGKNEDIDLIMTMGTQSAKRASQLLKKKPVLFTVVGSPIRSGIISQWKSSGCNITGIGTPNQVLRGIQQIYELIEFDSIGIVYLKGSPSHEAVYHQVKAMCKKNGLKFFSDGFSLKDKNGESLPPKKVKRLLRHSLRSVLPKVSALYIQASGTYTKNFDIFRDELIAHQVPSFGEPIYIKKGIIIGVGVNNFAFGKQAADYAVKILEGHPPSTLPMDTGTKFSILANIEAAQLVNFDPELLIPILNSADAIYQTIEK